MHTRYVDKSRYLFYYGIIMEYTRGMIMAIRDDYLIEKRNDLNEIRANGMTLQELRFFSIYLSKINSRDIDTRVVRFSLSDFQRIMEFNSHIKIEYIKKVTNSLLCKVVNVPTERGGYEGFQLFMRCKVDMDDDGEWYVEIDAHDQALPLLFKFKDRYFTYELWNALRLKSSNQLRMYEVLKQYEKIGERIISVKELRELLGIASKEYPRYGDFKMHVLDVCQRALEENTDIKYTYEPNGKKGKSGKILSLKFTISKNGNHKDQLSLNEFVDQQKKVNIIVINEIEEEGDYFARETYPLLNDACNNEFDKSEIQVLYNLIIKIMPYGSVKGGIEGYKLEVYDYLKRKHDELNWRAGRTEIKSRFGYLKKILETDLASLTVNK